MSQHPTPASPPAQRRHYQLTVDDAGATPLQQLATHSGLSRQELKRAMNKGAVWIAKGKHLQRWRRVDKKIPCGTEIHLYYDPNILSQIPPAPQLISDLGRYSVWYKPYGLYAQGSHWGDHFAIDRWVAQHQQSQRPVMVVHRLDRAASGLILLAHAKSTAAALSAQFQARTIDKRYQAIVEGEFPADTIQQIDRAIDGRTAISHVSRSGYDAASDTSEVQVRIETGRKHQIRRHLADAGFPIIGDRLYGGARRSGFGGAWRSGFGGAWRSGFGGARRSGFGGARRSGFDPVDETDTGNLQLCAWQLAFDCPIEHRARSFILPDALKLPYPPGQ